MNELAVFLSDLIFNAGFFVVYYFLLKDQFKYSPIATIGVFWFFIILDNLVTLDLVQNVAFVVLIECAVRFFKFALYKGNTINCFNLDYLSVIFINIFGNGMVLIISIFSEIISGKTIGWINFMEIEIWAYIVINISILLGCCISYKVCMIIKDAILNMKGLLKYIFFFLSVVPAMIIGILKGVVFTQYSVYPSGFVFVVDSVTMAVALIVCGIVCVKITLNNKKKNNRLFKTINETETIMSKNLEVKEQLKELNHDIKNYMSLKGTSHNEMVDNYCREILEKIDDGDYRK